MLGVVEVVDEPVCVTIQRTAAFVITCFRGWWGTLFGFDEICSALKILVKSCILFKGAYLMVQHLCLQYIIIDDLDIHTSF